MIKKFQKELLFLLWAVGFLIIQSSGLIEISLSLIITLCLIVCISILITINNAEKINLGLMLVILATLSTYFINIKNIINVGYYALNQVVIVITVIVYALLFTNLYKQKEKVLDYFKYLILGISLLLVISFFIEFIVYGKQPGEIIKGNKNLSASFLLVAMPTLATLGGLSKYYKFLGLLSIFTILTFVLKARFSAILAFLYLTYEIKNIFDLSAKKIILLLLAAVVLISCLLFYNDRFNELINGNSLLFRWYSWNRLLNTLNAHEFFWGYSPGAVSILFSKYQYLIPQIEIISGLKTFHSSHNYFIDAYLSGGVIFFLINLILNLLIIIKFFRHEKTDVLKYVFVVYILLLLQAMVDIHNHIFSGYLVFILFQFILIGFFYKKTIKVTNNILIITLVVILGSLTYYKSLQKNNNHIDNYKNISRDLILNKSNSAEVDDFEKFSPHFMRIDFFKMYHYLVNNSGEQFNKNIFEDKILTSRKYNKYFIPQIHVSSQYYSFVNNDAQLLEIYSDLIYLKMIEIGFDNISLNSDQIQIKLVEKPNANLILVSDKVTQVHTLFLPVRIFENFKRVNSSFGPAKISNEFIQTELNNFQYNGFKDSAKAKKVVQELLISINLFSERFSY